MKILKSRTVWMFVALFVINGFTGVRELLPGSWLPIVDGLIGILGIYFRANPSVKFENPV